MESGLPFASLDPYSWTPYHWDEPVLRPQSLEMQVVGGTTNCYPVVPRIPASISEDALMYTNAVYLCVETTWQGARPVARDTPLESLSRGEGRAIRIDDKLAVSSQRLVLDVPHGEQVNSYCGEFGSCLALPSFRKGGLEHNKWGGGSVILRQHNPTSITQLWQVLNTGQIQHFVTKKRLDILGRPPNAGTFASLVIKEPAPERGQTQHWTIDSISGVVYCGLPGLTIMARNGVVQDGCDVMLGSAGNNRAPLNIKTHKRRPGSGAVLVKTEVDGATVVVKLLDASDGDRNLYKEQGQEQGSKVPIQLQVKLAGGIGLSIINHIPEEVMYLRFVGLAFTLEKLGNTDTLELELSDIQADNQCREGLVPVVLHPLRGKDDQVLYLRLKRQIRGRNNLLVFPEIQAVLADFSAQLDEVLLLKLLQFARTGQQSAVKVQGGGTTTVSAPPSKGELKHKPVLVERVCIQETTVNVSLIVAPMLEEDLKELHNTLGLSSFLNFSDVSLKLGKYERRNLIAAPSTIKFAGNNRAPLNIKTHKRRPGSGAVLVKTEVDGATVVVKLLDASDGDRNLYKEQGQEQGSKVPIQLQVKLAGGIGLSIINHIPEEVMYLRFVGLAFTLEKLGNTDTLELELSDIQADNQCREGLVPVVLRPLRGKDDQVLYLRLKRQIRGRNNLLVFPEIQAVLADFSAQLDEVLLLKLLQFARTGQQSAVKVQGGGTTTVSAPPSKGELKHKPVLVERVCIQETTVNVSLIVAPMLEEDLKELHNTLGLSSFLNFSDVSLKLGKYERRNLIAAPSTIKDDVIAHYRQCAGSHVLKIVLNSEAAGNMGGLVNDLISAFSVGMEGDVTGMVKNVAHGMSDTANKLTSTASSFFALASGDENFQNNRERLRAASVRDVT
eukprot:sb/3461886/